MPGRRSFFVYIVASATRVLYTGVTNNLRRRVAQHRAGAPGSFTNRYHANRLVWFEVHESPSAAIRREKQIKAGSRQRKIDLVEASNPFWVDLWETI